jgi:hypothetical protein
MPPRRRSSINPATVPLSVPLSPSKIPRRKSALAPPSPSRPTRRRSSLPAPKDKITPRNSLADGEDLPKETPYAAVLASVTRLMVVEATREHISHGETTTGDTATTTADTG